MEDIINRGGGRLAIQLYLANEENGLEETGILVQIDGVWRRQLLDLPRFKM